MLNRVVLIGRMTRNPELRRTSSGAPVASFTIALNRNNTANKTQQADFIPCVVWNKGAENVSKYCSKGSLVGLEGRLQSRSYQTQDGRNVNVVEVICDSIQFLETKGAKQNSTTPETTFNQQYDYNQINDSYSSFYGFGVLEEDV